MAKEALILAGGFGTRLKSIVNEIPKPMALIKDLPFLSYLLEQLHKYKFDKIILAAGYKSEVIESYFGTSYKSIKLVYSVEDKTLGTGGAISKAMGLIQSDYCIILNGDTFFEVDLEDMEKMFRQSNSGLMVALKLMVNFDRYGAVVIGSKKIVSFNEKKFCANGLINGGIYIVNKNWFEEKSIGEVFSFEKDILEKLVSKDKITYYISEGYFIDIGVPEDYIRASEELPYFYPLNPPDGGLV